MKRLRGVFQRFRDSGISLNPSKCTLGLNQVEYVGHTISKDGTHFTRDKLDSVVNFPRPETKRQMKSFLGLANYFRDHIKNHSMIVMPLQRLVDNYSRSKSAHIKIKWNDECEEAFNNIKEAIDNCPLLWFLDNTSPICLATDASDYGIGAYLYQVITSKDENSGEVITTEHPIAFVSKSIRTSHAYWDVPTKEGYAIFYALKKWEYLLRDKRFTIYTDHKNLIRLRADHDTNRMVQRWFMCFQEFDIDWKHIEGQKNLVADAFSRLCDHKDELEDNHLDYNSDVKNKESYIKVQNPELRSFLCYQLTGYEIPADKWEIISRYHGTYPGHLGIDSTEEKLHTNGHNWLDRRKHVERFIKMCPCCQKMSRLRPSINAYPFTLSSYGIWQKVSIDFIEKLWTDKYNKKFIVVIIDNFSRFIDLYATSDNSAEAAADAVVAFCGRYVTPSTICTDNGVGFKNDLMRALTRRLGINHQLVHAYSKEENGIVERANKEVLRHLRNIICDKRIASSWSHYLPIVQRIINTQVHSATGMSPAEIVFPDGNQLDRNVINDLDNAPIQAYVEALHAAQANILKIAEENLRQKDKKHMEEYSNERTEFDVGSFVLAEHRPNALRGGPKSKLLPYLIGPLRVISKDNTGHYTLRNLVMKNNVRYHVTQLRPYRFDERTKHPVYAATADTLDEFVPEAILDHYGDPRKRQTLRFKVRWIGAPEEDETWEPWINVRDSEALQTYLYYNPNRRMKRLAKPGYIPPNEREPDDGDVHDE